MKKSIAGEAIAFILPSRQGMSPQFEECLMNNRRITILQIVEAHATAGGNGNSDQRVLDRFIPDVLADRLEGDALMFYAMLVQPQDVRHYVPTVDAVMRLNENNAALVEQFRFRVHGSFTEAVHNRNDVVELLESLKQGVAERMESEWPKEETLPPALQRLLDAFHQVQDLGAVSP